MSKTIITQIIGPFEKSLRETAEKEKVILIDLKNFGKIFSGAMNMV